MKLPLARIHVHASVVEVEAVAKDCFPPAMDYSIDLVTIERFASNAKDSSHTMVEMPLNSWTKHLSTIKKFMLKMLQEHGGAEVEFDPTTGKVTRLSATRVEDLPQIAQVAAEMLKLQQASPVTDETSPPEPKPSD